MNRDRIVAVALLTERDLSLLGANFSHVWPVEDAPHFHELLTAIDDADRTFTQADNRHADQVR